MSASSMARYGENALEVIRSVKAKIDGDRAAACRKASRSRPSTTARSSSTARSTTLQQDAHRGEPRSSRWCASCSCCTCAARWWRSSMLPVGVLIAFIAMRLLGINSNIMSLGGIAIAIGAMVDAAIVMIENAHKHLERRTPARQRCEAIIDACREVGPALFFSLLIITVSFLPVFTLEAQEGRLFAPLAYTKTFAMAGAALLSVTLVPVLMMLFIRGRITPEAKNPLNRFLIWLYRPVIARRDAREAAHHRRWQDRCSATVVIPASAPRHRVHADTERGHAASTCPVAAGHVGHQGRRAAADAEQDHQELSRGGVASTARRDARRPRPTRRRSRCSRPSSTSSPSREWRPGMTIDKLIAEMDTALQFPGSRTPGRCRSRRASTCCRPASARRSASRCSARTSSEMERLAQGDRGRGEEGPRHHQRLRRAHHRRVSTSTSSPTARRWRATGSPSASCRT